uniref:Uncharacterized protein n=1 Tax=Anguilla anguilla TaxID=7936 RepID=A0A0E9WBR1_ANGAN
MRSPYRPRKSWQHTADTKSQFCVEKVKCDAKLRSLYCLIVRIHAIL